MDRRRAILLVGVILIFIPLLLGDSSGNYKDQSWPQEKVDYALRLMYQQAERQAEGLMESKLYRQSDEVLKRWLVKPSYKRFKAQERLGYHSLRSVRVNVIMKHNGSEAKLSRLGVKVRAMIGDILTASIPLGRLPEIASLEEMSYIQLPTLYRANAGTASTASWLSADRSNGQSQGLTQRFSPKETNVGTGFIPVRQHSWLVTA